jgi:hypothetical protein
MGHLRAPAPVMVIAAATSRYEEALAWGRAEAEAVWGPLERVSEAFAFTETDYYEAEMGGDLRKQFWAFEVLRDPSEIVAAKRASNQWEEAYAGLGRHAEARPLNVDPGYLTLAKLVLASTKDHAHRIYLGEGIFAEVTLNYRRRAWTPLPWTYPDYRRGDFQEFFSLCRESLQQKLTLAPPSQ